MSKRETDISLIRKYLNGELDARAMHQLERRAQDDPFLMDALEGYENSRSSQHNQLDELAVRLGRRVEPKQKRIIPLNFLAIAASILVVFTIGWLWLNYRQGTVLNKMAVNRVKQKTNSSPAAKEYDAVVKPREFVANRPAPLAVPIKKGQKNTSAIAAANSSPIVLADNAVTVPDKLPAQKDTTPLNEMVVMGYVGKAKMDTMSLPANANIAVAKKNTSAGTQQLLQSQAVGVAANNKNAPKPIAGVVLPGQVSKLSLKEIAIRKKEPGSGFINGRVVAGDDGLPIPGASVKMAGTNFKAVTDANGLFSLPADSSKTKLVVGYLGYKTREVNAAGRDSLKTISLEPANSSLSEVVVTEYTSRSSTGEPLVIPAHPKEGWHGFKKYLKEHAVSPDGKKGIVKLSFTVSRDGLSTDIKISKGLSGPTDKVAIDLVKNGPKWAGNSNGMPEKVTLRIKFSR